MERRRVTKNLTIGLKERTRTKRTKCQEVKIVNTDKSESTIAVRVISDETNK